MTTTDQALAHAIADTVVRAFHSLDTLTESRHADYWTANACTPAIELMQDNHHALKGENGSYGWAGQWGEVLKLVYANESKFSEMVAQLIFTCNRLEQALFNSGEFALAESVQQTKNALWKARHEALELN